MDNFSLTPQQEQILIDTWNATPNNPPDLKELTQAIFGPDVDGRSKQAEVVKRALAKHSLKATTTKVYHAKRDLIELSEAHKIYITNNSKTNGPMEIAKIIFANPAIIKTSAETRVVANFMKTLDTRTVFNAQEINDLSKGDYRPPSSVEQTVNKICRYIDFIKDPLKLSASQRKNVDMLMGYLNTYRFVAQMNAYSAENERKLCEDAFIRYTYDKPDLTQEELDQYIMLANEIVMGFRIQRRSETMQGDLEDVRGQDEDARKYSMGLVEAIGKAQQDFNNCIKRQQDLINDLKVKRSARLDKQVKDNASVLNLIQLWKQEETRKQMLEIAGKEQKKVSDEVDKLTNISDIKARIFGLTKDEARYG